MDKHDTLLIASGSVDNRQQLRANLSSRYNLLEAMHVRQAMLLLRQNLHCICAILLDITQPEKIDRELLDREESRELLRQVPVIVISRDDDPEMLNATFSYGAADVIPMDYDPYAMLHRIENIVDLHLHKQHLESLVEEQADTLRHSNEVMVDALSSIIEYRSVESGQHILRIRHFTKILLEEVAKSCPEYHLNDRTVAIISSAAALHDIGKIAIPDAILMKPGPLTEEEREIMKTHSATGCQILQTLNHMGDPEYLRYAYNICRYHHERWDGKGYPDGLSGEDIPICAQVVGLADVYDALTTKRVYKDAFSFDRAVNMILRGECGSFSPKLLECFKNVEQRYEKLARDYADGMSPNAETFDMTLPAPDPERETDSIERTRAKYFALVHYINAFLMEVDFNRGRFHLIYNPYPEFAQLQQLDNFDDLSRMILETIVMPGERERMEQFLSQDIQNFLDEDLRRMSYCFRLRSRSRQEGEWFEVTLLRINPMDGARRTLAVLCRKLEQTALEVQEETAPELYDATFTCRNDEYFTLIQLGDHVHLLAGYTREELKEQFHNRLTDLVIPEDREKMREAFREQLHRGTAVETEFRVRKKDGKILWVQDRSRLTIGSDGREMLLSAMKDITEAKRSSDEQEQKLRRYELILAQTENVLFEWDCASDSISFSDTWQNVFGFQPLSGGFRAELQNGGSFHPDDLPLLVDHIANLENGSPYEMMEVRMATAMGRYIWCRLRSTAIRNQNGDLEKVVGILINIDAEKQAERMLQDRAERDSLTKLLNKRAARKQAEEYLLRFPKGANCALLVIDLDNFKQVNDRYGHLFGDAVLTKTAREIEGMFRAQDIVARIGGDEFLVLMRGVSDRGLLENRCQRLLDRILATFRGRQYNLPLSCSIGIAVSPEHGTTYYDLFNRADQALYRAKTRGKNGYAFYDDKDNGYPGIDSRNSALNNPIDSDVEPGMADDNIVRFAFQKLYSSENVEQSIQGILGLIGEKMKVSRVYVFENSKDNRFCSNTFEWCSSGIRPVIGNMQDLSYERDLPGYEENFDEQGIFYCPDISILPEPTYDIVASQGVLSMLHCAIRENGVFRGFIGFDECVEQRMWTGEQIHLLSFFSEMLSMFLLRMRRQEKVQQQADELRSILDNQNAWIYIIDPDTCKLKYLNAKTRSYAPDIETGMYCYRALRGEEQRCQNCPARNIRETRNSCALIFNEQFNAETLAEATLIQWNGEDSCLMTCREWRDNRNLENMGYGEKL